MGSADEAQAKLTDGLAKAETLLQSDGCGELSSGLHWTSRGDAVRKWQRCG
ncbi:hypothetical protein [Luteolibacter luteus]|uniref:Uncharacterized protein n=1 Tax=Luteolibacter luteus TaxID=2728835 RepID=A0A858RPP4_9BACT|nr:hypothetical protein [Luteolibacter luteus]QJE98090.1 hypothetical protein HHL09_20640 [Luteolibacter luteus]